MKQDEPHTGIHTPQVWLTQLHNGNLRFEPSFLNGPLPVGSAHAAQQVTRWVQAAKVLQTGQHPRWILTRVGS